MRFIDQKIRVIVEKLNGLKIVESTPITYSYVECPEYKKNNTPPAADADWKVADKYQMYSGVDSHYWIHFTIDPVEAQKGREPRLSVKTGREGQWDASNPQIIVYVNGKNMQAMDTNHTWLPLEFGKKYDIYLYLYNGMEPGAFGCTPVLEIVDIPTESLYYDLSVPHEAMKLLDENSMDYIKIIEHLDKAILLLDIRDFYSEDYYKSIDKAIRYLYDEFYGKVCGNSDAVVSCIGHTHIDVAWLWTVAQTREKAQRSFSTVLNMMRRYDDYKFMSSQPQLYQHVKEEDPELYAEIKERIKEGRWEAEGAMWLEADTNLISGESLVRQIMYGKRFMQEEFGVDNKILWLPDVFGYSGALPQILRKTGVSQFFTTKMNWNETNKMPNDNFEWEGIDGSKVFTAFIPAYVLDLNPKRIKNVWDSFKNKNITNETLFTFGFGDGGGGPTYKMMENLRRLQYGLPGTPKTVIKTAGEYMDKVEEDFYANTVEGVTRPKWIGEMYLEMHRGTYTSMAKNKKNNRKSELMYQEAETIAATDMVLLGGDYPADVMAKNQTNILLNQFHDIIPGSSIKEVYDVTDIEYEKILREGREIADRAIENLKTEISTDGGIFVYNPTPFMISDYVTVDGETYFAENVPAHGWKVIAENKAESGVSVTEKVIENDVIRVTFNEKYHIISVFDKEEEREVLSSGAEANRMEVFEDYPREFDAWEITEYYKQKMWIADDVSEASTIENGLRIKRNYGKSTISQDIKLKPGSKRIDFITTVDWHEDHVLLKAAFPVDIRSTNATYDIQFGNLERPTHRNTSWDQAKFEVCAHKWADLSEDDYGVSILNDCKYGYSIEENVMKISLLKCATYPNPEADRGINEFTYSFYPHKGNFKEGKTVREGYLLNMPLEASRIAKTEGKLSECYSFVASDKENVVVETVKKAEDDGAIVVRMYETYNRKSKVTITTGFDFKEVYICDMLENNETKLEGDGRCVKVDIKNFEIVTLKFVR